MRRILHFCGMLSRVLDHDDTAERPQVVAWSPARALRNVADMQESGTDDDRDEYLSQLGMVLQLARKAAGFSQIQAAERLQMSAAAIGRWEAGANKISGYDLVRLIRLYDFDPDLAVNPPTSRVVIRRRLQPVAKAALRAARQGVIVQLPQVEGEPE